MFHLTVTFVQIFLFKLGMKMFGQKWFAAAVESLQKFDHGVSKLGMGWVYGCRAVGWGLQ